MKTLSHLQNEAMERFEKAWVTSYGKIIYGETGFLTTDAGEPFRIEKDLVKDFLKTELETIVKESFKNTRVEEAVVSVTSLDMIPINAGGALQVASNFGRNQALSDKHNKEKIFLGE